IRNARFELDGTIYEVEPNFQGRHNLHGGSKGLGNRVWKITGTGPDFVTLATVAADGEMGFPGNLNVSCTYMLNADGTLIVRLEAVTDKTTVDRKSTRLNSSHVKISYAVFCLKKK